jgi:hypothetical protein
MPDVTAVVLACSRRDGAAALPQDVFLRFGSPDYHEAFLAFARGHQLLGLVLVELAKSAAGRLPPGIAEEHQQQLKQLRRQAALWDFERDRVVSLLQDREIPVVVLKGAALRLTAYRDPAERPFGDIDILVPKESLPDAVALLEAQGYARHSEHRDRIYLEHFHHLVLSRAPGFKVEVHWALAPAHSTLGLDPEGFRREAVPAQTVSGPSFRVPAPEHMVIHLSAQNVEDGLALRRLVDLDRIIAAAGSGFDWSRLGSDARRMDAGGVVALSLRLAERLLGTAVPPGFLGELGLSRTVRTHLAMLDPVGVALGQRRGSRAVRDLLALWCTVGNAARWGMLRDMVTGRRERAWRDLLNLPRGPLRRLISVALLGGAQLARYPAALIGRIRARDFWGDG